MKIKKLTEAKKLVEEEELTGDAPVKDIADEIEDTVDGISPEEAATVATETKVVADAMNADQIVINDDDWADAAIENKLTKALDKAYKAAKEYLAQGAEGEFDANVLVEGLPGAGKTAIVKGWCASHGLTLVEMNATDPKIETAINGMPLRDTTKPDANEVVYSYVTGKLGPLMNDLHPELEGKCVLFVDELNRQKTPQLRRPFMNLFCGKRNADGTLDFRKNLLFSVVCINPFGTQYHDPGVGELIPAEKNRFPIKRKMDSDTEEALRYFIGWKNGNLLKLGIIAPETTASKNHGGYVGPTKDLSADELEKAKSIVRRFALAHYILSDAQFNFDTRQDAENIYFQGADYLTSRSFTNGIALSDGYPKDFLVWVDEDSELTDEKKEMLHDILSTYVFDEMNLYKDYNLDKTPEEIASGKGNTGPVKVDDTEVEDDDDLFTSGDEDTTVGGKTVKTAGDVESEIGGVVDSWF